MREVAMSSGVSKSAEQEVIACRFRGRDFMKRKEDITRELFRHAEEVVELNDGFEFRFPGFTPWAGKVLDFIGEERACCPFFSFELAVEPNDGPVWLRLRGSAEVKAFVLVELGFGATAAASLQGGER